MTIHPTSTSDLALLLGPRQAEIMRLLWLYGPATAREVHTWLIADQRLAYTTVKSICDKLVEKGLLERNQASKIEAPPRYRQPYTYTPLISEADFTRTALGQHVDRLLAQYPALVQAQITGAPQRPPASGSSDRAHVEQVLAHLTISRDHNSDIASATIAALLDRAEAAERTAATTAAELHRAELRAAAAERRAVAAEERMGIAERRLAATLERLGRPPQPERRPRILHTTVVERHDASGICRVCAAPAPPAVGRRSDDLRVCEVETCRAEARRRDNAAKQRRQNARQRAQRSQVEEAAKR